jgi:hypothetical protein
MTMAASTRSGVRALRAVAFAAALLWGHLVACGPGGGGGSTKPYDPPPPPPPTAHELFDDTFSGPGLDQGVWIAHGGGVSVSGGMLCIESGHAWESGVEAVEHFFHPRENDYLTITGECYFPADTTWSTSMVYIQDHWRPDDPDCYFFEFKRNQGSPVSNRAYFGVKIDGDVVEHEWLASFSGGATYDWKLTVYPTYCVANFNGQSYESERDVQDLGLSLHSSGAMTYWKSVDVTLWDVYDD